MRTQMKKKFILFLVFILITVFIFPGFSSGVAISAKYVALGDSTGFGLSGFPDPANRDIATLDGFNDQFSTWLGYADSYKNLAWPGDRTCDLFADLDTAEFMAYVRSARVVTITIGGNNLLGPSIAAICGLWGINPADYTDDLDGREMLTDLADAIAAKYQTPGYDALEDFSRLMDLTDPVAQSFHVALLAGLADFKKQWPQIAAKVRSLNSTAELYVSTVHNPLQVSGTDDPLYPLYLEFETLLGAINLNIRRYALTYRYRVVDVNRVCKDTPGAITFDILGAAKSATAMMALDPESDEYAALKLLFLQQTDPHPSYIGHTAVFKQMKIVKMTTPYWYWR